VGLFSAVKPVPDSTPVGFEYYELFLTCFNLNYLKME